MAKQPLQTLVRHLHQMVRPPESAAVDDRDWLARFVQHRDSAAFAALVQRHGPMVSAVCRRLLRQESDIDDAFQATFLVLLRKARTIRKRQSLASWLYGVAYRVASRVRNVSSAASSGVERNSFRSASRERNKFRSASTDPSLEAAWRELCAVLDAEVHRLSERYRAPLVLCYLEGQTRDQAARQLGWSLRTLDRRLEEGRERLRVRLARRGITLSAALLTTGLSQQLGVAAVPPALAQAACGLAAGQTAISPQAILLAEVALKGAVPIQLKVMTGVLLVAAFAAAGAGALARQMLAAKPQAAGEVNDSQPAVRTEKQAKDDATKPARTDLYGDPLPEGARARLGTVRWRHGDQVMAVAYSPDGNTIASGSMDEAIHLWDAKTGKLLRILRGHEASVNSVLWTPHGKKLVSCGGDQTARVWDVATGKEIRRWQTNGGWKLALSPDGKLLAGPGRTHPKDSIFLWDVATGIKIRELPFEVVHDGVVDLAFSPDGTRLVSGGGSTPRLFDVAAGKQLQILGGSKRVNSVAFSPDGKTVAVGREEAPTALWDVATLKESPIPGSDPRGARAVAFSPDGKTLAIGGWGKMPLWDVASRQKVRDLEGTVFQVWSIAFSPDNKTVAVGNLDSQVRLWDVSSGKELPTVGGHRDWVNFLAFVDRGRGIASASAEGKVRQWDLATAKVVREFQEEGTQCYCGDLSPDGRMVALGDGEGAHLFDWATGKKLHRLKGNRLQLWAVAFSPKGNVLASAGNMDQYIVLWDVTTGKQLRRILTAYVMGVRCLAWSPNGKILASAGPKADNPLKTVDTVCLWDPVTGERLQEWTAHQWGEQGERTMAIVFSPDGTLLASAGGDKIVGLWEAATGTNRISLRGHQRGVMALAFSPDGRMLASGGMDRTVRLWELATGKERRRYEGHLGSISKVAFSKDGQTLASASGDTSVLVWSVMGSDSPRPQPDATLSEQQLKNLWNELAGDDAARAWRAACTLAAAPKVATAWLQEHLKPMSAADLKRITLLIKDLDSDQYAGRQQAARELEKLGQLAEPALRKTLESRPTPEVRRQVERLLEKLGGPVQVPEILRGLRSVELLEHIGTPEAQQLLKTLAAGAPEARLTQEAKASLERLPRRPADR